MADAARRSTGKPRRKQAVAQFSTMCLHIAEEKAAEKEKLKRGLGIGERYIYPN